MEAYGQAPPIEAETEAAPRHCAAAKTFRKAETLPVPQAFPFGHPGRSEAERRHLRFASGARVLPRSWARSAA
jgi:hypothetical protein